MSAHADVDLRNYAARYLSARDSLLELLGDLRWHHWTDLRDAAGVRYSARLLELRRLGYRVATHELVEGKRYRLLSRTPGPRLNKMVRVFLPEDDAALLLDGDMTEAARTAIADALGSFRHNRDRL